MLDKKGFLFTVTIFLVLIYILLSISVWVKSVEVSERAYSDFYKQSTIELAIEQLTPEKMDQVSYLIMNRALYRLDTHAIDDPVSIGPADDESENIRDAMFELLVNGSANSSYFATNTGLSEEANSSFKAWVSNINTSLEAIGVYISDFNVENFSLAQGDMDLVNYSFDLQLSMADLANSSSLSRVYHIQNQLSINGLVDPAIARESKALAGEDLTIYRMFFFDKELYPGPYSISADGLEDSYGSLYGGQGWLYGYLATADSSSAYELVPYASDVPEGNRQMYILVGTYSEIVSLSYYDDFGGYILTNAPGSDDSCADSDGTYESETNTFNALEFAEDDSDCVADFKGEDDYTSKPFIVAEDFDLALSNEWECPLFDGSNSSGSCVVFINDHNPSDVRDDPESKLDIDYAGIYVIETIRDFVMCGYYTNNTDSPSYFQRLMEDSYDYSDTVFGIETFVIGIYANDSAVYDTNSRLDRELFDGSISAYKIRGLPGCKTLDSCTDDSDPPNTGIFAASEGVIEDYNLDVLNCESGAAGCEQ